MVTKRKTATKSAAKKSTAAKKVPVKKSTPAPVSPAKAKAVESPRPLRTDGPTLAEYVKAGYSADNYPPQGYAARSAEKTATEAGEFQRPLEPATETDVPVGRFPAEDTPESGSGFAPAPGRFPEE